MSKERKVRNFDFLKQTASPLPSREEVIQKTAELTGQSPVGDEATPSVSGPIEAASVPASAPVEAFKEVATEAVAEVVVEVKPIEKVKKVEKEKKNEKIVQKRQKVVETLPPPVVQTIVEKSKVGRRALADARKPFTTTITLNNKRQLRQLCAEHDIAMSDVINEILAAHFEQRTPNF